MERYLSLYLAMLIPIAIMLIYGLCTKSRFIWGLALLLLLIAGLIIWSVSVQVGVVVRA